MVKEIPEVDVPPELEKKTKEFLLQSLELADNGNKPHDEGDENSK
jgi:hypothetical protein